ncbi:MAG: cytochrome P450 [Magnetococcus sp. WYHC-3]
MSVHRFALERGPLKERHWLGVAMALSAAPHLTPARLGWSAGGVARFRILGRRFAAITDGKVARQVLQSDLFRRSFHYTTYQIVLGQGLFSSDGPSWARRRRLVQPAFRPKRLEVYHSVMGACVGTMLRRWHEAAGQGRSVDAVAESHRLTLDIIGRSLFSMELGQEQADHLSRILTDCLMLVRRRNTALVRLPSWLPTPGRLRLQSIRRELDRLIIPPVDARLAHPHPQPRDMLDDLIAARHPGDGNAMTRDMLVEEAKTLFITGYETTAVTLSWILYLLAAHPEEAAAWHRECDRLADATASRDSPPLNAIINEGMRLLPVVYNLARVCVADTVVEGHAFNKGETLLISMFGIHRSGDIWGDPDHFRPQRFLHPDCPMEHFMPFAAGKHMCIGAGFAEAEIFTALRHIGRHFTLGLAEGAVVGMTPRVTLAPDRPILLTLAPRS